MAVKRWIEDSGACSGCADCKMPRQGLAVSLAHAATVRVAPSCVCGAFEMLHCGRGPTNEAHQASVHVKVDLTPRTHIECMLAVCLFFCSAPTRRRPRYTPRPPPGCHPGLAHPGLCSSPSPRHALLLPPARYPMPRTHSISAFGPRSGASGT